MTPSSPHLPRYAGLDGLRAIAVGLVLVYHLFPGAGLASGFVGVDVFFVVSGFLITSLLLRPTRHSVRHRMLDFWRRRARRLLPAMLLMLLVCCTVAWMIGGDVLVGIGRQLLGAATFSYNWVALAGGTNYFAATEPELFRNVWSLAVEEQFYLIWPVLLLAIVAVVKWRWMRVALAVLAAAGSAWWMSVLVSSGAITRAYFGTDSHAFGLMLGIALAFAAANMPVRAWMLTRPAKAGGVLVGAAGLALIIGSAVVQDSQFPGVLLAASLGSLLVIFAGILPGSWFGRAIDVQPLKWIGDRSYGIYLWHWPVLLLVTAGAGFGVSGATLSPPASIGWVALAVSVAVAAFSYRFVETPLRRLGFRRALRAVGARFRRGPLSRLALVAAATTAMLFVGATTAAVANAPAMTSAELMIRAGEQALRDATAQQRPKTPSTPVQVSGADVTAVGDSVMLASAPALYERLPGVEVDAKVSRSIWSGPEIIDALASSGKLRQHVVVALGTNGSVDLGMLQQIAETVGIDRDLVLVNAYAPRDWIPGVNSDLETFAARREGVVVADWSGAIAAKTELLAGDKIHPGMAGGRVFAEVVEKGIQDAAAEREARSIPHWPVYPGP